MPLTLERRYYRHPLPQLVQLDARQLLPWRAAVSRAALKRSSGARCSIGPIPMPGRACSSTLPGCRLDDPLDEALASVLAEGEARPAASSTAKSACAASVPDLAPESPIEGRAHHQEAQGTAPAVQPPVRGRSALRFFDRRPRYPAAIAEWTDAFLWLEASGWKARPAMQWRTTARPPHSYRLPCRVAEPGRLERALTLSLDEFADRDAGHSGPASVPSFKTAFDERYARFSPGVLLSARTLPCSTVPTSTGATAAPAPTIR